MWLPSAVFCLLLVLVAGCAADKAETDYQARVAAAKQASGPIDWQALRLAYTKTAEFDPFDGRPQRAARNQKMMHALVTRDFSGAAREAERRLDRVYVDIDAHQVAYLAYRELGDAAREKEHLDAVLGLMRSMQTGNGDGQTPASAFGVISIAEEYSVLFALRFRPTGQALIVDKETGYPYDRLDIVDFDGTPRQFYFRIDRVLAAESGALKKRGVAVEMPPGPAYHYP